MSRERGPIVKMAAEMDKDDDFQVKSFLELVISSQNFHCANSERHISEVLTYKDISERTERSVGEQLK